MTKSNVLRYKNYTQRRTIPQQFVQFGNPFHPNIHFMVILKCVEFWGCLSGSAGWASAFGPGHVLRVLGSSSTSGSLLTGDCASLFPPTSPLFSWSLSLRWTNKIFKTNKQSSHPKKPHKFLEVFWNSIDWISMWVSSHRSYPSPAWKETRKLSIKPDIFQMEAEILELYQDMKNGHGAQGCPLVQMQTISAQYSITFCKWSQLR